LALLSNTANIVSQSDQLASRIFDFMESKECPSDTEGNNVAEDLITCISDCPETASAVLLGVMHRYAKLIDQFCAESEVNMQ
jgi:hypothetical protein